MVQSVGRGFRWIDDVTIKLGRERPSSEFQLKVSADTGKKKYSIRKSNEQTLRRVSNERIPCNKSDVIVIELFEYRREHRFRTRKVPVFSRKVSLDGGEIHTKKLEVADTDNTGITIALEFSYSTGGELRERIEEARIITDQQKVVLDKIKRVHVFFEQLEGICSAIKEIHPYIEGGCHALLLLYKLCENQKECRDAARSLVDEMDDLLKYGVERLAGMLKENSTTRAAFKSIEEVIEEILEYIKERNNRVVGGLRDTLSSSHKEIDELREKFKRAKASLKDSITYGVWELAVDDHLKNDLKSVWNAYYKRGAGCLPGTRVDLLSGVDTWVRSPSAEKIAWVHGYAGSGKSALLNSIARNLEKAYIPFTCFVCKRDDAERSDVQRILSTICYDLTRYYDDYCGTISNTVKQPEGRSIATGDVATQMEILFGESPSYRVISPKHARRPPIHVILIDALDECKDSRERSALAQHLRDLANGVPWIKVIITSRREPDIVDVLADATQSIHLIDINDKKWKTSTDIGLFIETQSAKLNLGLSPDQVERFRQRAGGLFVWCSTVFRYIERSKRDKKDIVNDVLTSPSSSPGMKAGPFDSLYALYRRVLDSAVVNLEDRLKMEMILGIIFVAATRRPLSANAIADILYPNERGDKERVWVNNIIESLFAIVYVEDGTKAVRMCHPSVLDFIGGILTGDLSVTTIISEENISAPFSARLEEIHVRVFDGCFTVMNRDLRFNICSLEDSQRLNKDVPDLPDRIFHNICEALQYGCLFWASHLEGADIKERGKQVLAFLNSRAALFWVETLSLLDAIDRGIVALQDCAHFFVTVPNASDMANEWEWFLSVYGDASKSTPHLYLSALSWLPGGSRLWHIIHNSFSSELAMIRNVPEVWNGEKWLEKFDTYGTDVTSVAYSRDGRMFAAGCRNGSYGSVQAWESRLRKKQGELIMTDSKVLSVTFSTDNDLLASCTLSWENCVRLWDLSADPAVLRVLKGHTNHVYSSAFSSDGKRVASGSSDMSIIVWDVKSGTAIGTPFRGHNSYVTSLTFSAGDTRIISGSSDWTVRIWDLETGEQIGEPLVGHSGWVRSISCSLDGKIIATGSDDKTIRLWDADAHKQIGDPLRGHSRSVISTSFSFDRKCIASGSDDRSIRIWNVETRCLICELKGHMNNVRAVAFSPDGRSVLSGSSDGTVRIWDVKGAASIDQPSVGKLAGVSCISYVPGSNHIVSGSTDGSLNLWDARTGAAVGMPMQCHAYGVDALAVSSDGLWIVSSSYDKTLRMWDIASGTALARGEPMRGHSEHVNALAISSDNQVIASASDDKTVRLWDVATFKQMMTLEGHEREVTSVAFSADSKHIISGSLDSTIRIWDTRTGEAVGQLRDYSNVSKAIAVSPDGQWIASGSYDKTVQIWSIPTLSRIHVLRGHFYGVISVVFAPDSRYVISGSEDRTIRVWNALTGEAVGSLLTGHTGAINSISFATNANEFASASSDGTIRICDMRARTDLGLQREDETSQVNSDEEALRIRWNSSRARVVNSESDGWIRDGDGLLLWVPLRYRSDIYDGTRVVIGSQSLDKIRPQVDYRKMFRYSGMRWKDVYTLMG